MITAIVLLLVAGGGVVWQAVTAPPGHTTEDARLTVLSGPGRDEPVELDTTLYVPASTPAPAVLLAHGFGGTKDSVRESAEKLAGQGYVVLAYTARGFGNSGGEVHLNQPDYEVNDARALLDWLSRRSEVELDRAGDPRVAAVGGSYGGALSLLLAGYDQRVDAIVPQITWNDLAASLFPNNVVTDDPGPFGVGEPHQGVLKKSWAGLFFATGMGRGPTPNPACGRWAADICAVYQRIVASGELDDEARAVMAKASPKSVLDRISAPTLLVQGEADTLFGLDQADANARGITGAPVRVAWYSGGHDAQGAEADRNRVELLTGQWLAHYLKKEGDAPGGSFTYSTVTGIRNQQLDMSTLGYKADSYSGLSGASSQKVDLAGRPQAIASPPNGTPAAISSLPSLGSLASLAGSAGVGLDLPGQFAAYESEPLSAPLEITGAPTVRIKAASPTGEATLFVKLYDVPDNGNPTLPNGLIAPVKLTGLATDIAQAQPIEVRLPGIAQRFDAGHRLRVVIATADQAYANPVEPVTYTVVVDGPVTAPTVTASLLPSEDAIWQIALVVVLVAIPAGILIAWLTVRYRARRRVRNLVEADAETPLVVAGLRKTYKDGFVAVDGVDFRVERGQVVGLLGPNGAGKTTTLRTLMGLLQPTSGSLTVFGHQVTPGAPVLSRLGALVEGPGLLPHLSGVDNLRLFWRATGRPIEEAHLDEVIKIADLGERIHRKVRTYSHGMKQRVAIAQAMLGLPELLVLDEPTDGLDPPQIAEMRRVLHEYARDGRAVLVSSHLLAEVEQTCTHVVVMSRGRVVGAGEVADVIGTGTGARLEDAFLNLVENVGKDS
ncbi:ABC transporter ATP-binding protein [Actinorhabdospora filicis]|uniref:ABC transporter ATP-binding protein n=1 Tax=Actinorhabdospora filicis TaxID=1785913 RepID=A0A9W6SH71_9ACTN|nr:ABC transporter ATP-binding protein [Actinorhabdospora filicis]